MHMTVDWETQGQEMILVWYQSDDGERDSTGFIVGKPLHDNADDERRALERAVTAAIGAVGDHDKPMFRLIVTEQPPNLRAIWGTPNQPITVDAPIEDDELAAAVIAAAHALIEAKLDPHADTAA